MTVNRHMGKYIQEHRALFTAVLVGLFLLELEILVIAATRSGPESALVITDMQGQMVYEATGRDFETFDPSTFEKTFGPIENYRVRQESRKTPFPFRAWFVSAAGIPLGGMLLFAFFVRAFVAIFQGDPSRPPVNADHSDTTGLIQKNRIERILDKIGRLNIFTIGFFMFLIVISYWILPNAMVYLGKVGIDAIIRYRWLFIAGAATVGGILVWIIYLKYLLAKKQVESQAELEKYRLELQYDHGRKPPLHLASMGTDRSPPLLPEHRQKDDN